VERNKISRTEYGFLNFDVGMKLFAITDVSGSSVVARSRAQFTYFKYQRCLIALYDLGQRIACHGILANCDMQSLLCVN